MLADFNDSAHLKWKYDVFLSFRGEDTRGTFTDHLYYSMKENGINVFIDDKGLPRGEDTSTQLTESIWSSKISVVVFSKNYADSRWCLQELVEIMGCRKTLGQMVLPVFYDVDPSHVRKQSGSFEEAFARRESNLASNKEKDDVARWRAALSEAGKLSGWDLTNLANGKEAEIVREVVHRIWIELRNTHLDVAQYPVGLDPRLDHINEQLCLGSNAVMFVGICGIGGIGKTTLAKAVYNQLFHTFKAASFIANVREHSKQPNGLVLLQEQLLHDITKVRKIKLGNVYRGSSVIKERLCRKRVLIVLDDLSHLEQLSVLAREREWFGSGSRIIITTRDADLLREIKVDYLYMPEELNHDESLQLFSWHAFRKPHPEKEFTILSEFIISYCKGLPLALEVLGSFLLDRSVAEWISALGRLQKSPPDRIQSQLQLSYDALSDDSEKDLFLDIACFFVGHDKDYVIKILNGCNLSAEIGLSVLTKRSLVKITKQNELHMHDLIRDMGREIVRQESPKDPAKRSRLWSPRDVIPILQNHLGDHQVEGLVLNSQKFHGINVSTEAFARMSRVIHLQPDDVPEVNVSTEAFARMSPVILLQPDNVPEVNVSTEAFARMSEVILLQPDNVPEVNVSTEAFARMSRLRLLQLDNVHVHGDYGLLSKELRWLCWHGFPQSFIPDGFYMGNLVAIDMQYSKLRATWKASKFLGNLKVLNFSCSRLLAKTPNFSELPRLEELILKECSGLKEVDQSIGHLRRLVKMNLEDCKKLRSIPSSICMVKSLQVLNISGCSSIDRLPDDLGSLYSLSVLLADETAITRLPPSMISLTKLTKLSLNGCKTSHSGSISSVIWSWISHQDVPKGSNQLTTSLLGLSSLTHLSLRDCNLSDDAIPAGFESLHSLESLDLSKNNFCHLPAAIGCLSKLVQISMEHCIELESFPDMPPSLIKLNANNCLSLERLSLSTCHNIEKLGLMNCSKLLEIFGLDKWKARGSIRLDGCKNLSDKFKEFIVKDWERGRFVVPGNSIPEWFECRSADPSITFRLPPCNGCRLEFITLGIVYTPSYSFFEDMMDYPLFALTDKANKLNLTDYFEDVFPNSRPPPEDHTFMFHFSPSDIMGDSGQRYTKVQLDLDCDGRWTIKEVGAHLQIKSCPSCQLSFLGKTVVRSNVPITSREMIPCDHLDATASSVEQGEAGAGPIECSSMGSPQHKRMRYDVPRFDLID